MTTSHGSSADVLGNGYLLSPFFNSASQSGQVDMGETTTFGKTSKTYIPGLRDTTMNFEGIFDGDVDMVDQVLQAALDTTVSGLFTYLPYGMETQGNYGYSMDAVEASYEINTDVGDVAQVSAELNAGSQGQMSRGFVAQQYGAHTAGNSTFHDGLAATTTKPMSLVIHATVASSLVAKLQHATTSGGAYSDLPGTISISSGRSSQRLVVPAQSINRYTRVSWTGTGTFIALIER